MLSAAFVDLATYSYPESIIYGNEYFNYSNENKFVVNYYILFALLLIFILAYFISKKRR
jgi:hypothetical protein